MFFARTKGLGAHEVHVCLTQIHDKKLDHVTGKRLIDDAKERRYACGVFSLLLYQIRTLMLGRLYRPFFQTEAGPS